MVIRLVGHHVGELDVAPVVEQDVVGVEVLDQDLAVVQGGQHLGGPIGGGI